MFSGLKIGVAGQGLRMSTEVSECADGPFLVDFSCKIFLGPICVGFSLIGKKERTNCPSYEIHQAYYKTAKEIYDALVLENVPEYDPSIIRSELGSKWDLRSVVLDPRIFGIAACRSRLYAIAFKKEKVAWRAGITMEGLIEVLAASVCAGAGIFWWQRLPKSTLTTGQAFCRQ